jgi:hypothetical protein
MDLQRAVFLSVIFSVCFIVPMYTLAKVHSVLRRGDIFCICQLNSLSFFSTRIYILYISTNQKSLESFLAFLKLSLLCCYSRIAPFTTANILISKPQSLSANRNNSQIFSRLFLMWHSNHT